MNCIAIDQVRRYRLSSAKKATEREIKRLSIESSENCEGAIYTFSDGSKMQVRDIVEECNLWKGL